METPLAGGRNSSIKSFGNPMGASSGVSTLCLKRFAVAESCMKTLKKTIGRFGVGASHGET